jgi:hypothetical protein
MIFDIVQGTNRGRSKAISCTDLDNFYPEIEDSGKSKSTKAIIGCPGYRTVRSLGNSGYMRKMYTTSTDRLFTITSNKLNGISTSEVATLRGSINTFTGMCDMVDNGVQILIVDGTNGYIYNLNANVLTVITNPAFPVGASKCIFTDGYFIVNEVNSGRFWFSTLYDGSTWNALSFATSEYSADVIQGIAKTSNGTLWMIGKQTVELWQNVGIADLPWRRIQGAVKEVGCSAPDSIASNGDQVFWLGYGAKGYASIYMGSGYDAQKISTSALEYRIKQLNNIENAVAYTYSDEGHSFYVISFGSEATYVYDITTGEWHRRSTYNYDTGESIRQSSQCYAFFNGKHYVGNYLNCTLSEMNLDVYTDNGSLIKRTIMTNHMSSENKVLRFLSFEVDAEKGGNLSGSASPDIVYQFSNDGGNTWSDELPASVGLIGEYTVRSRWTRLGSSRDRVNKLTVTAPIKWVIVNAFTEVK